MKKFKDNTSNTNNEVKVRKKRSGLPWYVKLLLWFGVCDILITAGIILALTNYVYGTVYIDAGPTIVVRVNREGTVTGVYSKDPQGKAVIGTESLKGSDIDTAVSAITLNLVDQGIVTDEDCTVLVSATARDSIFYNDEDDYYSDYEYEFEYEGVLGEDLMYDAGYAADDVLSSGLTAGIVMDQVFTNNAWTKGFANRYGISPGKAALITSIVDNIPSLSASELAGMSLTNIVRACYDAGSDPYEFIDILGSPEDVFDEAYTDDDYDEADMEDEDYFDEDEDFFDEDEEFDEADEDYSGDAYWENYDSELEDNEYTEDEDEDLGDTSDDEDLDTIFNPSRNYGGRSGASTGITSYGDEEEDEEDYTDEEDDTDTDNYWDNDDSDTGDTAPLDGDSTDWSTFGSDSNNP